MRKMTKNNRYHCLATAVLTIAILLMQGCQQPEDSAIFVISNRLLDTVNNTGESSVETVNIGGSRHYARSLIQRIPATTEWMVTIPSNEPVLEFLLGYRFTDTSRPGTIECSITAKTTDGDESKIFDLVFWANKEFQELESHYREISLDEFAGKEITLSFTSRAITDPGVLEIAWAYPVIYSKEPRKYPNILIICLDTLRSDKFSPLTPDYQNTPRLAELSEESVVFENAISQAPWTLPSVSTVLTGLFPSIHGAGDRVIIAEDLPPHEINKLRQERGFIYTYQNQVYGINSLREDVITIADVLRDNYRCHMVNSNAFLSDASNMSNRFTTYHDYVYPAYPGFMVTHYATEWIRDNRDKQFFLYVHYMDVHEWANRAGEQMPRQLDNPDFRERAKAAYDEMVLMTDQYIGMILDELRKSGRYDDTVIIFYSDHGEHMWEDEEEQFGHGNSLDNVLLHVPLMVKFPGSAHKGERVSEYVGLIDIFSTVLDFSGHSVESPFEKHSLSLKQLVETGSGRNNRELISEFTVFGPELIAIQVNEHRLVHTISTDKYRLRMAATDEKINPRKEPGKEIYEALLQFLESYNEMVAKMAKEPHMMKLERNLFKTFRDLGYIN